MSSEISNGDSNRRRNPEVITLDDDDSPVKQEFVVQTARQEDQNYQCCRCGWFTTHDLNQLEGHISERHLRWLPYECVHCGSFFATAIDLETHLRVEHVDQSKHLLYSNDANDRHNQQLLAQFVRQSIKLIPNPGVLPIRSLPAPLEAVVNASEQSPHTYSHALASSVTNKQPQQQATELPGYYGPHAETEPVATSSKDPEPADAQTAPSKQQRQSTDGRRSTDVSNSTKKIKRKKADNVTPPPLLRADSPKCASKRSASRTRKQNTSSSVSTKKKRRRTVHEEIIPRTVKKIDDKKPNLTDMNMKVESSEMDEQYSAENQEKTRPGTAPPHTTKKNKPDFCVSCQKSTNQHPTQHLYEVHLKQKTVKCPYCDFGALYATFEVNKHVKKMHADKPFKIQDQRSKYKAQILLLRERMFPNRVR